MTDHTTRRERYGRAAVAGQLRIVENRTTDLDTIAAAGMAGVREPLGLAMWRAKYANDRHAYRHAQSLLIAKAANSARKRRWAESPKVLKILICRVFEWSVFGVCPTCQGRGHLTYGEVDQWGDGRQVLADDLCPVCHGDGATPIEAAVPVQHIGRAKDIAQLLFQADMDIDSGVWRRLSQNVAQILEGK